MGLLYTIEELNNNQSKIRLNGSLKEIIVNYPIEKILVWWYQWQMQREFIQNAFSAFTPAEREFIMTGITESEWNETFSEKENA